MISDVDSSDLIASAVSDLSLGVPRAYGRAEKRKGQNMRRSGRAALSVLCSSAVLLTATACGGGGGSSASGGDDNTITWWHNSNNEPGKGYYEKVAADFEADNPGVDVEVVAMAHEDMVDKLEAAFQSGDVPDVYMERGGREHADHVEAGMVRSEEHTSAL